MLLQHYEKHASIVAQVAPNDLEECQFHCGIRCRCSAAQVEYKWQHVNICNDIDQTRGSRDLLYAHADMWINIPLARTHFALGSPVLPGGMGGLWPQQTRSDQQLTFRPPDTCLSVGGRISDVWEPRGGRQSENWGWWDDAWPKCQIAALASNMTHCCCGWSDLLYLPAAMVMPFCKSAALFRDVWHEVAIPTILHALTGREQTAVTLAHCLGGCCENVPWSKARLAACSHKVDLRLNASPSAEVAARFDRNTLGLKEATKPKRPWRLKSASMTASIWQAAFPADLAETTFSETLKFTPLLSIEAQAPFVALIKELYRSRVQKNGNQEKLRSAASIDSEIHKLLGERYKQYRAMVAYAKELHRAKSTPRPKRSESTIEAYRTTKVTPRPESNGRTIAQCLKSAISDSFAGGFVCLRSALASEAVTK